MSGDAWGPLEELIGPAQCECFMYMGKSKGVFHQGRWQQLCLYKHVETRCYVTLAFDGTCFRYRDGGYTPISFWEALVHVFT